MKDERTAERPPEETPRRPAPAAGDEKARNARPPKRAERPVPGVKHVPEPDAENIMPAENEPGTL